MRMNRRDRLLRPSRYRLAVDVLLCLASAGLGVAFAAGCAQNEIGRYAWENWVVKNPQRVRAKIIKNEAYWIQKEVEPEEAFPGPTPVDLAPPETDYILGPNDLIDITVQELLEPGRPFVTRQRITQTGQVSMPYVGAVKASGLTIRGLEEKLADILEPDYLIDPQVTVFIQEFRNLSVSVLSGMFRPGVYQLRKQDQTLLELVAEAGGVTQLVEDHGFVIREYSPEEIDILVLESGLPGEEIGVAPAPAEGAGEAGPPAEEEPPEGGVTAADREMLQEMAEGRMPDVREIEEAEAAPGPGPEAAPKAPPPTLPPAEELGDEGEIGRWVWYDGEWVEVKEPQPAAPPEAPPAATEGEEPPAVEPPPEAAPEAAPEAPPSPVDMARLELERKLARLGVVQGSGQLRRIIRFDVEALMSGDPTQNLVLRDGDVVTIPAPPIGDFYMVGQIARPGVYSLTGRKITLLQAVAAAGGLTAVAVPWRTEVVRRLSEEEAEIIYVDLAKIARGDVPDFYLHPEDIIRVGTDQGAIYNAVLRNSFRATYGLGAVYDTNFADFYPWTDDISAIFTGL